jgi:hypothetical protein
VAAGLGDLAELVVKAGDNDAGTDPKLIVQVSTLIDDIARLPRHPARTPADIPQDRRRTPQRPYRERQLHDHR